MLLTDLELPLRKNAASRDVDSQEGLQQVIDLGLEKQNVETVWCDRVNEAGRSVPVTEDRGRGG